MAVDLKDTLRRYVSDEPLDRDAIELLRVAGLLAPTGYMITEMGRTLMVQNPPQMPGCDPDNPRYLIKPGMVTAVLDSTLGKLGPTSTIYETPSAKDTQVGGDHYKKLGHHQPWEVLATWMTPEELRGYMKGTVIAYLAREQDKGGDTDVAKSLHTMQLWQEVRKDK